MADSPGKRDRQRQKAERARVKTERRAARQSVEAPSSAGEPARTESQLIAKLSTLQMAFEAGDLSPEDFEAQRDLLRIELEQLL